MIHYDQYSNFLTDAQTRLSFSVEKYRTHKILSKTEGFQWI